MKIKNLFGVKKRVMNQDPTTEKNNTTNSENNIAEELKLSSDIEASEQKPLEEDPIAKLEGDIAELKDAHLRLFAEFENYKRRTIKERAELIKNAGADTLAALLPVLDDFDRAMKAANANTQENSLKEGVVLIQGKLNSILEQRGLKAMQSIGEDFNVDLHEAITNIPVDDESKKGKVIDEVEKGYFLNDKVIRYAKVVVGA